jgi:hypothetical protein
MNANSLHGLNSLMSGFFVVQPETALQSDCSLPTSTQGTTRLMIGFALRALQAPIPTEN